MEQPIKSDSSYNNNIRRVFHFVSITVLSLIYGLSSWTQAEAAPKLAIITSIFIFMDILRLQVDFLNTWVQNRFKFLLRKHELRALSGTSWFLLGALISLALFPKAVSVFGFLVLAIGDPSASFVGIASTNGQKIGQKTWAGCWAFFLISWLVGSLWLLPHYSIFLTFTMACVGSFFAALAEKFLNDLDDNLIIPVVASGASVALLSIFGG